ncbi:tautomerase family protein [Helicobacter bizzozeronii]|uniref:Tautomerase n=1 Tax=Helicobacter bizzozeronii (strain CIII-1) TaxID=1002804 RepID=F8KPE9_HELBC|nr:4-oxalocrotonate tautomerase family protein [Helicobacter bizzozeronii]CCB80673.1 putative isomerase [Helicobacter bizzozeronii CIII-1]CCF81418.1 Putative isomerase [Helicobacter bizzozeronii CCUG 35545]
MPFINIKITQEEGQPTKEQKQALIAEVTQVVAKVLKRDRVASTTVIIEEISTDNYGLGGKSVTQIRGSGQL